ncbi:MAG: aminopeptidase P family protein [Candidatus Omnitrophica bacterium]|nr:aminopeptidase P family protein [Candidatus Omnitrophota bacterium]
MPASVRLRRIRRLLIERKLDALLITHPANISYLTDYASRDSWLLVMPGKTFYFTDSRYTTEAKNLLSRAITVRRAREGLIRALCLELKERKLKRVGFEERYLSFAWYAKVRDTAPGNLRLIPSGGMVEQLRQVKDEGELKKIRRAVAITGSALRRIKRYLKPGITELEVAGELERIIRCEGASASSFEIIVASGPNGSLPHHIPSKRKLRAHEAVTVDIGVVFQGYRSDLTRTFFLGTIKPLIKEVYSIVREAQERVFSLLKPGCTANALDAAARGYIKDKGYGAYFSHNLGHGVGVEVHEAPFLSGKSSARMEPGMVLTVEPGIYLPNKFGIRIEDMLLVTQKGCDILSGAIDK